MTDIDKKTETISMPHLDGVLEAAEVNHLPIIRAYADKIGFVELINQQIDSQMEIDPGTFVLGMIIDTLSGRNPLYHLEHFFEGKEMELLLGKPVSHQVFNDDNAGRVMDKIYHYGTQKLFNEIAINALKAFPLLSRCVHFDTTSVSVYGEYLGSEESSLHITYGHSKDKRPDLKQFIFTMLCIGGNVPIFGKTEDGNSSDKTINNDILSAISNQMKEFGVNPGSFIYVADSAVVTPENLTTIGEDVLFISRLPATYGECDRVIHQAFEKGTWEEIGSLSITEPTENRPTAEYKMVDSEVTLYNKKYRAIVVHSSSHDRRRQKRLDKEIKNSHCKMKEIVKSQAKEDWFCREDAEQVLTKIQKQKTEFHQLKMKIIESPQFKRGRPKKDGTRTIKRMRYRIKAEITENSDAVKRKKDELGCFVLLTNVPKEGKECLSAKEILKNYKEQHGIEKNFGFLKDDAIVNALFLKTPARIEVLGLILLISLLIWRLMEKVMRDYCITNNEYLHGWDKKLTQRPTSYMMTIKFQGIVIIKLENRHYLGRKLNDNQLQFLRALGLSPLIFTHCARDG